MNMPDDILKERIKSLPAILSIREIADFFSVRYLTIYRLIQAKKLPAWKDEEGGWCVARADLLSFSRKNTNL